MWTIIWGATDFLPTHAAFKIVAYRLFANHLSNILTPNMRSYYIFRLTYYYIIIIKRINEMSILVNYFQFLISKFEKNQAIITLYFLMN